MSKKESIALIQSIHSILFWGYRRHDKVVVKKDGKEIRRGSVEYYGTHGAQEFFFNVVSDDTQHKKPDPEIFAKDFTPRTTIEIETWVFFSENEFLEKAF